MIVFFFYRNTFIRPKYFSHLFCYSIIEIDDFLEILLFFDIFIAHGRKFAR